MNDRVSRIVTTSALMGVALALLAGPTLEGASSEIADAAMKGSRDAVRALLQRRADVNAPQVDGTTALHWAVRQDDLELATWLIEAGARVSTANRDGATPM